MNKFIKPTSLLVLVVFLLFYTTSCGDPKPGDDPIENPDLDGVEFKNKDNTVYVRVPAEPDRLNPLLTISGYARFIHSNLFLQLLRYDPHTLKEIPTLAKSMPAIELVTEGEYAGTTAYTYELFENARWSDGTDITAKDVIFTFKALFNLNVAPAAPYRPGFFFIADIVADPTDNNKFTVYTDEAYFLAEASISGMTILPVHAFDPQGLLDKFDLADIIKNGEQLAEKENMKAFATLFTSAPYSRDGDKLIGSGAYRFNTWEEGQVLTMSKIDNWWAGEGHPNLVARPDSLVFRIITDQATSVNALKGELIDICTQVDATDFSDLKSNEFVTQHYNFHSPDAFVYYYIAINNGDPKLSDKRVRRALAHLLDVDYLINEQFQGLATRMNTPVLPAKPYYDDNLPAIELDIEKAKNLLREAGWVDSNSNGTVDKEIDGQNVELELDYFVSPGSKFGNLMAGILQDNASQAGIQINIIPREFRTMIAEDIAPRKYHLYGGAAVGYPEPDDFTQLWHTSSNTPRGVNRVQFGNATTDAIIDKIRITLDSDERKKLYKEFQQIAYDEQPYIFLFAPKARIIISKRFDAETTILRPGFEVNTFKHRQ